VVVDEVGTGRETSWLMDWFGREVGDATSVISFCGIGGLFTTVSGLSSTSNLLAIVPSRKEN
jgi:hypothetical protein